MHDIETVRLTSRILVVDRSLLLAWMVAKVVPPGVKVERASTFDQAERMLTENPPDAAVLHLAPSHQNWRRLLDLCIGNGRLIPFLCVAAVDHYEVCNYSLPCRTEDLIPRDLTPVEFAEMIAALVDECRQKDPLRFRYLRPELSDSAG